MRVGIRIPPCDRVDRVAQAAVEAERLGFDEVWFPDSQMLWRDVFCTLTAAATRTEHIALGTAVTNVVTRHPTVIASAARTIAELAPGRVRLGIGIGDSALVPVGLPQSSRQQLRTAVEMIRTLLNGEVYPFGAMSTRLRDPHPDVPIYLAASGPRNLRLAGEIGDGAILLSGVSPDALTRATRLVRDGAIGSTRNSGRIELTVSAHCCVTEDIERDARRLKPICVRVAQNGASDVLRSAGIDIDVPAHITGVYPDLVHAEDWDAAVKTCGKWISDADAARFASMFCLFGTGEQIATRLAGIDAAGATAVLLQHVGSYDVPTTLMRDVARDVLPRLARH